MSSKAAVVPDPKDDNEPSMEEILASIRKIIADDNLGKKQDEVVKKAPKKEAPPEPEPEAVMIDDPQPEAMDVSMEPDVLDLAEVASVAQAPEPVMVEPEPVKPEPVAETVFDPMPVEVAAPAPIQTVAALEDRIVSDNTGALVNQAFQSLSRHTPMPAIGRSIEDVVVELLRPMLRGWLDDHLPGIVEKLVKAEIERVARGG